MEKTIISGWELHESLEKAGIIPENCGDLIIEVPCRGVVTIHTVMWATPKLLEVIPTSVKGFQIQRKEDSEI